MLIGEEEEDDVNEEDVDDVYDIYDDSRRYTNATNTPTSDTMKEMVLYEPHRSSLIHQCVRGVLGGVGSAASQLL